MHTSNFIFIIAGLILIGILYKRYQEKNGLISEDKIYDYLQNNILLDKSLEKSKKPIIWIHIPYEYNERNWISFGSRSSYELNQPYLNMTVKTIIKNCDESFKICIIDDNSFQKLIPGWNIDMSKIADPVLFYIRQLSLAKLVYRYGGMVVPVSFLCFKNLDTLYQKGTRNGRMFIGENIDRNITSTHFDFYPNIGLMGAEKENDVLKQLIDFMERVISTDYTSQVNFLGDFNRWCKKKITTNQIYMIDGNELGVKTLDGDPVMVEELLGENYINFYRDMYGIWIPWENILKRTKYNWFVRMSPEQVLKGNFILAKYMLLSSAPDSHLGVIEPLTDKPDWISYWKVPSGAPVWGLKPNDLGDHVPRLKY
jgi:hypothetical protein